MSILDTAQPNYQDLQFPITINWTLGRSYSFANGTSTILPNKAWFYKSLDAGLTWTKPDSASATICDGFACFFFDGLTPVCNIMLTAGGGAGPLILQDFNLDTESYSGTYGAVGAPTGIFQSFGGIYRTADGSIFCFYNRNTGGIDYRAFCSIFTGGVWLPEIDIGTNILGVFSSWEAAINDPANNLVHVFYTDTAFNYFYRQIHSDGTLGPITAIPAPFNLFPSTLNFGRSFNPGYIRGGDLVIPAFSLVAGHNQLVVLTGTPANAPIFTMSPAIDGPDPGAAIGFSIGATDYVAYFIGDGTNAYSLIKLAGNSGAGWTTQVIYNATLDPTAAENPFTHQWLNTISAAPAAAGYAIEFNYTTWHVYGAESNLTAFGSAFGLTPPLVVGCGLSPDGTVGVPYASAFTASGGVPPYTFSIVAGALPAGLALDPATGAVTGVPTLAALSAFTVRVVDSSSAFDVFVDGMIYPRSYSPNNQFRGPWEFGGDLYIVVCDDLHLNDVAGDYIAIYRSADGGQTWFEQDAANHPSGKGGGIVRVGNVLHLFYSLPTIAFDLTIHYITFDLATQTWGADVAGGPTQDAGSPFPRVGVDSGGAFHCCYTAPVAGKSRVFIAQYSAGWGAPVQISGLADDGGAGADSGFPAAFLIDSSDALRIFWQTVPGNSIYNRSVSALAVLGAAQVVWTLSAGATIQGGPGTPIEYGGKICVPLGMTDGAGGLFPALFRAPSNVLDLVFGAVEQVSAAHNTSFSSLSQCSQVLALDGGALAYFWCTLLAVLTTMNSIYRNENSGSGWGADALYLTDAPSNATHDFFEQLSVVMLSSGDWGVFHDRIYPGDASDSAAAYVVPAGAIDLTACSILVNSSGHVGPAVALPAKAGGMGSSMGSMGGRRTLFTPAQSRRICPPKPPFEKQCRGIPKGPPLLFADYPHVVPPPLSEQVYLEHSVAAVDNGADLECLVYQVEEGYWFRMTGLIATFFGVPLVDGTGQSVWTLDVDSPINTGALSVPVLPSGYVVPGFDAIFSHLGNFDFGCFDVGRPLIFTGLETIRLKVVTAAPFPGAGGGVVFNSAIQGYLWPAERN